MLAVNLLATPSYPADDDSTPYNPYPETQTQTQTQNQTQSQNKQKSQTKKSQAKKRPAKRNQAPKKRAATRRTTPSKAAAPKDSLLQRAIALMEQGNYEQAKRYLLRAMNVNRNDPNVWYWYGKYNEYVGNYYQAQYFYSRAVKIDPSFEKLSRVVYYPKDPEKTPLWDPKRPARVYPVETGGKGITTMAPDAIDRVTYPKADTSDPLLPKVPVYTPPQPGTSPLPPVYVPPAPQDTDSTIRNAPVYTPPSRQDSGNYLPPVPLANNGENLGIIKEGSSIYQEVDEIVRVNQENSGQPLNERDRILRADKPLYNPDNPRQKVAANNRTRKTQAQQVNKTESAKKKQPAKKTSNKESKKESKKESRKESKQESAPSARKTVRRQQTQRQREEPRTQPVQPRTPEPRPVQPREPETRELPRETQPQTQTQSQTQSRTQREETRQQPRQQQYMPPVGQYEPDPGTISETPMPPVGQGN